MRKLKLFSILALLLMSVAGAVAQTETLLTTITATAKEQANYSTTNVATVSFSYTAGGSSAYLANWGWWGYGWSATVNAAEGYTITKCIFYDDANRTATDSEAPFVVETTEEDKTPRINGTPIDGGNYQSKGIKKIEVYGYENPTTVNVTGITLSQTEAAVTIGGETLTLTATVAPDDATDKTVTWTSSDESVVTVVDGVVTAVAAGTATITVTTTDGAKTATCNVTVTTPSVETLYLIGVDNWNPTVGIAMEKVSDNVFRCQVDFNATKYFAFSTVLADNNDEGGWAYVNAHRYAGTVADATLVPGEEMALVYGVNRSMQMTAGKYIITVDLNTMKVTAEAVLAEHLYKIGNNQGWDLANKVEMTKVENNVFEAELTFTDALSYFAFTTSSSTSDWDDVNNHRYASDVYQERVDDGSEVNLLAGDGNANLTVLPGVYTVRVNFNTNKVTVTQSVAKVIVSAAGYATYYNSQKAYTMPEGMTGYAFNAANGLVEAYAAGTIVPAEIPLVLAAAAGTYDLVFTEGGTPVDLASQLLGTDAAEETTGPTAGEYKFYGLSLDTDNSAESVGFYYMEENGAAFTNGAHKAYLAVPVAVGVAPRYIFHGENNATGVENIEANEQAVKFIENGKLYIRKNGVVYDATGAIVRQ